MTFNHVGFGLGQPVPRLEQITESTGRRVYNTPTGRRYPSVTTVLAEKSKDVILNWRNRIGADQANAISRVAAGRGTGMHKAAERYLDNQPPFDTTKTKPVTSLERMPRAYRVMADKNAKVCLCVFACRQGTVFEPRQGSIFVCRAGLSVCVPRGPG
jgi:hypothetical protein